LFYFSNFLSQFLHKPEIFKNLDNMGKVVGYIKVSLSEPPSEAQFAGFLVYNKMEII